MAEQTKNRSRREDRRQRRIERRRRRILEAAARIFAQKSYANTTTREIADEADIAEGTLYNYFGSKREILLAIASESETIVESILLQGEGLEDREAMIEMFEKGFDVFQNRLPFTRTLFIEAWLDDDIFQEFIVSQLELIRHRLVSYIDQRIAAGVFRPVDASLYTQMVLGVFGALIMPALRGIAPLPAPDERHDLVMTIVDLLLDGVRSRGALENGF
ncbi:MAG: TetR/AcrR family transcriptional regulator [Chloroflexota bacterium]|nr:TetR/AcrR family transcriptional regulator [Chloroflexota bacterium]